MRRGKAVQVDPVKLNLKPPGSELLKPERDEPLSNIAFKLKLRRYDEAFKSGAIVFRLVNKQLTMEVTSYLASYLVLRLVNT
jgi:hypothetical protein